MSTFDAESYTIRGIYRPGLSSLARLKRTTVGQQDLFADLLKGLEECAGIQPPDHTLFIGPPGIGKTHLMKILTDKLIRSRLVSSNYRLISFPVDNYRITSLELLLVEIAKILSESDTSGFWTSFLSDIENIPADILRIKLIDSVSEQYAQTGRGYLVLFENMDLLFNKSQQIKEYVDQFTSFLDDCGPMTFIGTACTFVADRSVLKCKPYNQFNIIQIKELNLSQTRKLVLNHLKIDEKLDLTLIFNELTPKIQALHELTGGNPRLILLMYDLLTNEDKNNIISLFEGLLDRVTPYYYDRIRSLSPFERALLSTLASRRTDEHTQSSLAKLLRITAQQCGSIIQRLTDLGYLAAMDHPKDKRSRIYKIKETFFDIWLAVGQLKDPRQFLPFLTEFLEKWYSDKLSRERKRQQLWHYLKISEVREINRDVENTELLLSFLSDIGDESERCQNYLELGYHFITSGQKQKGRKMINNVISISNDNPVFNWIIEKFELLLIESISNGFNQQLIDLFDCWKNCRTKAYDMVVSLAVKASLYFDLTAQYALSVSFLNDVIELLGQETHKLPLLARVATAWEKMGNLDEAIHSWRHVLTITEKIGDHKSKGTTLNNLSQVYQDKGYYPEALEYLAKALDIHQKINDYDGQSTTLNNIATVYFAQGYYERALEYFQKTLSIIQYTNDLPLKAITLSNISFINKERGEFETALKNLEQSLSIMRNTGNREGEAASMINISQLYGEMGDLKSCLSNAQMALQILEELRKPHAAIQALINTGDILLRQHAEEMAVSSWLLAKKVAVEYQLYDQLNQIENRMQPFEINITSNASLS